MALESAQAAVVLIMCCGRLIDGMSHVALLTAQCMEAFTGIQVIITRCRFDILQLCPVMTIACSGASGNAISFSSDVIKLCEAARSRELIVYVLNKPGRECRLCADAVRRRVRNKRNL